MSAPERKRSRWGTGQGSRNNSGPGPAAATGPVDDDDDDDDAAARALLHEAAARQAERDRRPPPPPLRQPPRGRPGEDRDGFDGRHGAGLGPSHDERRGPKRPLDDKNSYYGPASASGPSDTRGREAPGEEAAAAVAAVEKEKPNFGVSGALAKDLKAGNMYRGVLLKFQEPPEAQAPNTLWRLYVYKDDELVETLHINRQSAYLCGRNTDIADIPLLHPSCSSQHAVLQFRALPDRGSGRLHTRPYLMDLESANGTLLNGVPIEAARYYQLKEGDVLRFGASTREYVLLSATTKKI